jgi:hypothetical protein
MLMKMLAEPATENGKLYPVESFEPATTPRNSTADVVKTAPMLGFDALLDFLSDAELFCAAIPSSAWDVCAQLV